MKAGRTLASNTSVPCEVKMCQLNDFRMFEDLKILLSHFKCFKGAVLMVDLVVTMSKCTNAVIQTSPCMHLHDET